MQVSRKYKIIPLFSLKEYSVSNAMLNRMHKDSPLIYSVVKAGPKIWSPGSCKGKHPYSTCHEKRQFDVSFPHPPTHPRNVNQWQQKNKVNTGFFIMFPSI